MNNTSNRKGQNEYKKMDGTKEFFTSKLRTSIYLDEILVKLLKKRSKETGSNITRHINQSLNEYLGLVVR